MRTVLAQSLRVAKLVGLGDLALDQLDENSLEIPRDPRAFDCHHAPADRAYFSYLSYIA